MRLRPLRAPLPGPIGWAGGSSERSRGRFPFAPAEPDAVCADDAGHHDRHQRGDLHGGDRPGRPGADSRAAPKPRRQPDLDRSRSPQRQRPPNGRLRHQVADARRREGDRPPAHHQDVLAARRFACPDHLQEPELVDALPRRRADVFPYPALGDRFRRAVHRCRGEPSHQGLPAGPDRGRAPVPAHESGGQDRADSSWSVCSRRRA
jgi:hypothetical protein